jgi:hypothetical protein
MAVVSRLRPPVVPEAKEGVMSSAAEVAADLVGLAAETQAKIHATVVAFGATLQTEVRRNASKPRSGPPGPRLQTGNYVRSISRRTTKSPTGSVAEVGSNAPQARRLELGFTGVDSLGRHYHQPPYPHFAPALAKIEPAFLAAIAAVSVPK